MEIGITKSANGISSRGGKIPQGATVISPHLKKVSIMIDREGNQIDPVSKQVIRRKDK